MFDGVEEMGFLSNIKAKYRAKTDFYKTNNPLYLKKSESFNRALLSYLRPKKIDGSSRDSYNISSEIEFEKVCQGIQESTPAMVVKDMNVVEFYSKIELLKDREKER